MKIKSILFVSVTLFSAVLTIAHEYWIAPTKYIVNAKEPFGFNCYVGEDFKPQIWAKRSQRTLAVVKFHQAEKVDVTPSFIEKDSVNVMMTLNDEGNHLIAVQTKPSYIEMDGMAFNEYLKEDGMLEMLNYRVSNNLEKQRSRELYQRCGKSLLQVASKNDETFKLNTGMPLEIIPQTNPYEIANGLLPVYFEFKGKPLTNYQVRTWCKKDGKLIIKAFYSTNELGVAILPIKESGEWMISLVKMELHKTSKKADYESYWGSYTFYKN